MLVQPPTNATGIFVLRKEYLKAITTKRPRFPVVKKECSMTGCLSIIVNVSDHLKKQHNDKYILMEKSTLASEGD